jgi:ribonuclease BN (tRNA processing enzyme)
LRRSLCFPVADAASLGDASAFSGNHAKLASFRFARLGGNMQRSWSLLVASLGIVGVVALAGGSWAQSNSGASPPKTGTRLITLGTRAGPTPTVGRAQSSNLLIVNGALYVIDAGDGVTRRLTRLKTDFRDIENIFITHPHSDHTSGLGALMSDIYEANRIKPVNIYGPAGTQASVLGLLQYLTVNSDIRISDGTRIVPVTDVFNGHDTDVGAIFRDANVKVTAVENTHFHFKPGSPGYGKYKSYSYRFDAPDRSLVFTGDTGPSDSVTELARGADLLVSEVNSSIDEYKERQIKTGRWQAMTPEQQAGTIRHMTEEHLTTEEVGKMAARAGVKTVVLTHLPATADPKDDYQRFIGQVQKQFSGTVLIANDLMEF